MKSLTVLGYKSTFRRRIFFVVTVGQAIDTKQYEEISRAVRFHVCRHLPLNQEHVEDKGNFPIYVVRNMLLISVDTLIIKTSLYFCRSKSRWLRSGTWTATNRGVVHASIYRNGELTVQECHAMKEIDNCHC